MSADRLPVVFLMGPTASGKTDLAVELVQRYPMDIISVDSALVYREMNIGTAKPTDDVLRAAPHRLIDFVDPADSYSAGHFRNDALREIEQIHQAGRIPLLAGGTMLYYRALTQLAQLPKSDESVRARLEAQASEIGWAEMHERLKKIDPASASRIHPNDPQRIQRALEVYELTGTPMSVLWEQAQAEELPYSIVRLVIAPEERAVLHERIEKRFHQMLKQGFVEEVEQLRARGDLTPEHSSMRCVGYRQVWEYLDGLTSEAEMTEKGIAATRQLAKRQLTWLRAEPETRWIDSTNALNLKKVVEFLDQSLVLS